MANLRLSEVTVLSSTLLIAYFTEDLDPSINSSNIYISLTTNNIGVPIPKILHVEVSSNSLLITTQPMTPYISYTVIFKSSSSINFISASGTSFLLEDNKTSNIQSFLGAEDPSDPIRIFLIDYLKNNIYNLEQGSLIRDIINSQSINISKALYDIKRSQNDNYLSFKVEDEIKTRGAGPFDRLNEEGAYEITRVSTRPSGSLIDTSLSFNNFPREPITLLSSNIINEKLEPGTGSSSFDGLILNTTKQFVSKLTKIKIVYNNGDIFNYDISFSLYTKILPEIFHTLRNLYFIGLNSKNKRNLI